MAVLQHTTVVPTTIALCCAEAGRKRATSSMKTTSGITAGFRLCLLAIAAVLLSVLKTPLPAATAFVSMSPRFIVQQQGGDTHATARGDRGRRWDARARCKLAAASLRGRKGDGAVSSRNALASAVEALPDTQKRPELPPDFYKESLLDKVALALFRMLVQKEIGYKSKKDGYAGLIDEAQNYIVVQGATVEEQQDMVVRVLSTIAGPAVPPVYKLFMAPWPWSPFLTAFFTPPFFKFLVGPNWLDVRNDDTPGGVFVERCRFLEETNCKGLCTNMCKIPTERFFEETLGMKMAMEPDFDTYECRLSFGLAAPSMEDDDTVPRGCLSGCSCKELGAVVATTCSKQ